MRVRGFLVHRGFIVVGYDGGQNVRDEERSVEHEQKPRERSFIRELVPDRWPTRAQWVWTIRITVAVVVAIAVVAPLGVVLWRVLDTYIDPTSATEKKDVVQSFAVVVAGVVGSLSALAAVGNLYISRRNLQQQQRNESQRREQEFQTADKRRERELEVENRRAQDYALQAYLDQMSQLLTDKDRPLHRAQSGDSLSTLARVRTLSVLARLDSMRKVSIVQFLYESGLITRDRWVVDLKGADLSNVVLDYMNLNNGDLSGTKLDGARLEGATLKHTNLSCANLSRTFLVGADLTGADLKKADLWYSAELYMAKLIRADLSEAELIPGTNLSEADLEGANLRGAVLDFNYPDTRRSRSPSVSGAAEVFLESDGLVHMWGEEYHYWGGSSSDEDDKDTNLQGTNLKGADLCDAKLTDKQLAQCKSLEGATMSNGQKYEEWLETPEGHDWLNKYKKGRGEDGENSGPS